MSPLADNPPEQRQSDVRTEPSGSLPVPDLQQVLLDTLFEGVYVVDRDRRIIYWSPGAEALTGYAAQETVGKVCSLDCRAPSDEAACLLCNTSCLFTPALQSGKSGQAEMTFQHKNGRRITVNARVAPVRDSAGEIVGALQVFTDITRVRAIERRAVELEKLAFRDFLTGLPNRRYTDHKVQQAVEDCRDFGRSYGLLMIDLDHFKRINDDHGHFAGDALLQALARSMELGLRAHDMVGRWGGEEFLVLAADATLDSLAELAERCRTIIGGCSIDCSGSRLHVTASLGATMIEKHDNAERAIGRADSLMYCSKKKGGNCCTLPSGDPQPR